MYYLKVAVAVITMTLAGLSGLLVFLDVFLVISDLVDSMWLLIFCVGNGIICLLTHLTLAAENIQYEIRRLRK